MGCLLSRHGQVRTLSDDAEEPLPASAFSTRGAAHAWLLEIGLPQYSAAFDEAGFSDWDLLSCLTEADLDAITAHTRTVIPPGHRKKLLMASRQMGQKTSQASLAVAPPFGSVRRYSQGSNPGNGNNSRAGSLAAAAASALERRSYSRAPGRRPGSGSFRAPSAGPGRGAAGGSPHHHHQLHPALHAQRIATEDGLVSGRRSRAAGLRAPSRNSSRNSLIGLASGGGGNEPGGAGLVGHTIGYISSPSDTTPENGIAAERLFPRSGTLMAVGGGGVVGTGNAEAWQQLEGRVSAVEPSTPPYPAAAANTGTAQGGTSHQRRRRRWSSSRCAARAALISGGGGVGRGDGVASGSSMGWLDGSTAHRVPCNLQEDHVRPMSVTSSLGVPDGGSSSTPASPPQPRRASSRDLEALVLGPGAALLRNQTGRSGAHVSLAAARPERPYSPYTAVLGPLLLSPPRSSGGQAAAAGVEMPSQVRGSMWLGTGQVQHHAGGGGRSDGGAVPAVSGAGRPDDRAASTPEVMSPQPPQQQQSRAHGGMEGPSPARSVGVPFSPTAISVGPRVTSDASGSHSRRVTANELTLKYWPSGLAASPARQAAAGGLAGAAAAVPLAAAANPPGVAPAGGFHRHPTSAIGSGAVRAPETAVLPGADPGSPGSGAGAAAASSMPNGSRGPGSPGSALPRFVRAFAGWAMPAVSAAGGHTGSVATVGDAGGGGLRRPGSSGHTRQDAGKKQRVSSPQTADSRASLPLEVVQSAGSPLAQPGGELVSGAPVAVRQSAMASEPNSPGGELRGTRRGRDAYPMVPDTPGNRGPWDQDSALCIRGRGYNPAQPGAAAAAASVTASPPQAAPAAGAGSPPVLYAAGEDLQMMDVGGESAGPVRLWQASTVDGSPPPAGRGVGWPFVMPQLHQPMRMSHAELLTRQGPQPPSQSQAVPGQRTAGQQAAAASRPAVAMEVVGRGMGAGLGNTGPGGVVDSGAAAATAAVAAAYCEGFGSATVGGRPFPYGASLSPAPTDAVSGTAPRGVSHALLPEDVARDSSPATGVRRAQPAPSSQPHNWKPSVGSVSSRATPSSSDPQAGPHGFVRGGGGASAAAQWPAMPLNPPTRAKATQLAAAAAAMPYDSPVLLAAGAPVGAVGSRLALMELLSPEPPGPTRLPAPAAGAPARVASGGTLHARNGPAVGGEVPQPPPPCPPRPTPGRQLDLEVLADQVGRIMNRLSYITHEDGGDGGGDGEGARAPTKSRKVGGGEDFDSDSDAIDAVAGRTADGGGVGGNGSSRGGLAGSLRPGARMQALDLKRQELLALHRDLVTRVATMGSTHAAGDLRAPAASPIGPPVAAAVRAGGPVAGGAVAADALGEVEARIRAKLTELAELTSGGQPDGPGGNAGGPGVPTAVAGALLGPGLRPTAGSGSGDNGVAEAAQAASSKAGGRETVEAEVHRQVMALLGARKAQVQSGLGDGGALRAFMPLSLGDPVAGHGPAVAAAAAAAAAGNGGERAGKVLTEMHDALRAELLAIDSKIKARVRAPGAAVSRRA